MTRLRKPLKFASISSALAVLKEWGRETFTLDEIWAVHLQRNENGDDGRLRWLGKRDVLMIIKHHRARLGIAILEPRERHPHNRQVIWGFVEKEHRRQ